MEKVLGYNKLRQPEVIYRSKIHGNERYYCKENGSIYVGTTSWVKKVYPTSPHLINWMKTRSEEEINQILDDTSAYGTFFHAVADEFMVKGEIDLKKITAIEENLGIMNPDWEKSLKMGLASLQQFVQDYEVEVISTEMILTTDEVFRRGCAIDLVCKMNFGKKRVVALVDYKTGFIDESTYSTHAGQLYDNRRIFMDNFGENIDMVFNWSPNQWKKKPTYKLVNQTSPQSEDIYNHMLAVAAYQYRGKPKDVLHIPDQLKMDKIEFEWLDAEDYVRDSISRIK